MAKIKIRSEFAGKGCLLQAVALLLPFIGFAIGPAVGTAFLFMALVLFFYGSNESQHYVCSECGNKLESNKIKICPICKAEF